MGISAAQRVDELRQKADGYLTPLGVAEMPKCPQLFPQSPGAPYDWLVMRVADDPAYQRGELAIPPAERRVLRELDRLGVVFDEFLIVHEVPKPHLGEHANPSPKLPSGLKTPRGEQAPPAAPALKALSALIDGFLAGGKVLGAVALSPLLLAAAADPVLIGAVIADVPHDGPPVAAFFELVRWQSAQPPRRK